MPRPCWLVISSSRLASAFGSCMCWRWARDDLSISISLPIPRHLDRAAASGGGYNEQGYRFLIHDRDSINSEELDLAVCAMGVRILKTPFRSPEANSHCERLVGSLRRDCLDLLIPINQGHLSGILKDWKTHYCQARPHASLGPGLPGCFRHQMWVALEYGSNKL